MQPPVLGVIHYYWLVKSDVRKPLFYGFLGRDLARVETWILADRVARGRPTADALGRKGPGHGRDRPNRRALIGPSGIQMLRRRLTGRPGRCVVEATVPCLHPGTGRFLQDRMYNWLSWFASYAGTDFTQERQLKLGPGIFVPSSRRSRSPGAEAGVGPVPAVGAAVEAEAAFRSPLAALRFSPITTTSGGQART